MADYRKEGRYGMAGCGKESMLWQVVERKVWHGSLRKTRYGMAFFRKAGIVWQVVEMEEWCGRLWK